MRLEETLRAVLIEDIILKYKTTWSGLVKHGGKDAPIRR